MSNEWAVGAVAVDYYGMPAAHSVVVGIVVVAAAGIAAVDIAAAAVDSANLAAGGAAEVVDNVAVVDVVAVGNPGEFGSDARIDIPPVHSDSNHSAYLRVAATESRLRKRPFILFYWQFDEYFALTRP